MARKETLSSVELSRRAEEESNRRKMKRTASRAKDRGNSPETKKARKGQK